MEPRSSVRWSLQPRDKRLLLRIVTRFLIAGVLLLGIFAVIFEWSIWNFNRLSPEFRTAARSSFEAIRNCEPAGDRSAPDYSSRLKDAEEKLALLQRLAPLAQAQGDRRARLALKGYLHSVMECGQDLEIHHNSVDPNNSCHEMLRYRSGLDKWLNK